MEEIADLISSSKGDDMRSGQDIQVESEKSKDATPTKKLWVYVISGNRVQANGMAIEFVAPIIVEGEIEVEIKEKDIEYEVKFWAPSLIMYAL